jgi:hypothetical protein
MQDIWKSWTEVKKICSKKKKVILWSRSDDWIPKTLPKLGSSKVEYIVDINPTYNGTFFRGIPVFLPEKLKKENKKDIYIVITGGAYESISNSLNELGFEPGTNYCCTPEIKDWGLLQEIREYDKDIIIACSDYKDKSKKRHSKLGGGIYVFNTKKHELVKKYGGHFRQIIKVDDRYYAVEWVEKKVYIFSTDFKKVGEFMIDQTKKQSEKPHACGIAYHKKTDLFFISNAGSDTINIYERKNFKCIDTIHISDKFLNTGEGNHHINDICISGDNLLVSCFSISGYWEREIFDGGILSYDINNFEKGFDVLSKDLWMPHSVEYVNGNICYLDSMNGNFWIGNKKIEGKFPGFMRGLTYDERFYYIGQSETMYMSRLFKVKDNIMCNAGVYLFDVDNKVSRFYSFPFIMNVHDLLVK